MALLNNPNHPFLKIRVISMRPSGMGGDGSVTFEVETRVTLQWWKPSYWAWLREFLTTEPAWIAWPLAMWFAFRYGWQFSTTDPNKRP